MPPRDYYEILGVPRNADEEDIKRAYRRLARRYHPDVSRLPDAEERFKAVTEAYDVLRDPEKRRAYDRYGSGWQDLGNGPRRSGRGREGFTDMGPEFGFGGREFGDLFESMFGSRSGFRTRGRTPGGGRQPPLRRSGADISVTLEISLEEAYEGVQRVVQVPDRGVDAHGRRVERHRTLNVRVPPGVTDGQRIRLGGQGQPGQGGGPRGDAFLEVRIRPHRWFRLDGRNIVLDVPLTPWEAAFGIRLTVPTLGGAVNLSIAPGAQSGQRLRLRARGLPGDPPGDQHLLLQIVNPPLDDPQTRALYQRLQEAAQFDPRGHFNDMLKP